MSDERGQEQGGERLMTLPEVAEYLQIAERTAYLWTQTGKLPGFKMGNVWRFKRVDVDHWTEEQKRITNEKRDGSEG